jgi:transcriptional regulator GlxA family with amidase domain
LARFILQPVLGLWLTGATVLQWRLHQQFLRVRHLLETSDTPLRLVAEEAGFGSAMALRRHFTRKFGMSPSKYRSEVWLLRPFHR